MSFTMRQYVKEPTQKQYDLVGSPNIQKTMERIFETHKAIED